MPERELPSRGLAQTFLGLVAPGALRPPAPLGADGQPAFSVKKSPDRARRRGLLLGMAAVPFAAWGSSDPTAGLQRWGSGAYRRFGLLVYEATLWAGEYPLRPPLALKLTYRREIPGAAIAEASVKEMRQLGQVDEASLGRWRELMLALFPDVRPGDAILGEYQPGGARFYFNGHFLGSIEEPGFARAFFAIWLDQRSSSPRLREALLTRAGGAQG